MSTRSSNKNLIFLVAVLLLTNIAVLLYFVWFKKPEHKKSPSEKRAGIMIETLQKNVGFDEAQMAKYKELKELQKETVRPLFEEMRKAKESLFLLMADTAVADSTVQAAADAIAVQQKMLDIETLNHFRRVRALCTKEQEPKYDSAIVKMFRNMGKPPHKNGEGDKEKPGKK